MTADDRLAVALWEADRHAAALSDALAEWAAEPALDMAQLEADRQLLRLTGLPRPEELGLGARIVAL